MKKSTTGAFLVTTTDKVGLAMIRVAEQGFPEHVLETRDINLLASDFD